MKCKKARKLLSDYLDHLLSPAELRLFDEHVKQCPDCQERLQSAERLKGLWKLKATEIPSEPYRDSFWPRLKETLKSPRPPARREFSHIFLPRGWKPAYSVALGSAFVVLLLVYAGFMLLGKKGSLRVEEMVSPPVAQLPAEPSDYMVAMAQRPAAEGEVEPDYILDCGRASEEGRYPHRDEAAAADRQFVLASASLPGVPSPIYW